MKIWMVVNYPLDGIPSMDGFAVSLRLALIQTGASVETIIPPVWAGRLAVVPFLKKWLAYVDKFAVFPLWFRFWMRHRIARQDVIHVTDHGNAVWCAAWSGLTVVVTLHDALTLRAARGEETGIKPSWLGRWQQSWIEHGLRQTLWVACDSEATRADLFRLLGRREEAQTPVILLALNGTFQPIPENRESIRRRLGLKSNEVYLLHVGNNAARKNRAALLPVLKKVRERLPAILVLAGEGGAESFWAEASRLQLRDAVREWIKPTHEELCGLYTHAHALVFPSLAEGFGYPVIEAQACGCPVVSSPRTSLREVGGEGAWFFEPEDIEGMAGALEKLEQSSWREEWILRGFQNVKRFSPERMAQDYLAFYRTASLETGRS